MRVVFTILAIICVVLAFANFFVPAVGSRLPETSIFITHPLGIAGVVYLLFAWAIPRSLRRGSAAAHAERVRSIAERGAPLAVGYCSGSIGGVSFRGPLLKVTIYPAGVVIKPIWMRPFALALSEIEAVRFDRIAYLKGIAIDHSSPLIRKPLILYCRERDPLATTLRSLVGRGFPQ